MKSFIFLAYTKVNFPVTIRMKTAISMDIYSVTSEGICHKKISYCGFCQQIDVKANSDLKHVKDSLAAEKKKKKTLLKSFDDVSLWYYCNYCKFIILCILQLYQKLGAASQLTLTSWKREDSEFHCFLIACTS